MSLDNAIERLRNALQMHNENRTTMQSLASSAGDFLRDAATLRQQAGRVDGAMVVRACEAAELYNSSTLITTGAMRAALAALAQNTQGDGEAADPSMCTHRFLADPRVCSRCGWDFRKNGAPPDHAERARVPAGWVLVPREPTPEMAASFGYMATRGFHACYESMLSAAPSQRGEVK